MPSLIVTIFRPVAAKILPPLVIFGYMRFSLQDNKLISFLFVFFVFIWRHSKFLFLFVWLRFFFFNSRPIFSWFCFKCALSSLISFYYIKNAVFTEVFYNPTGNYMLKVSNRSTRIRCEICSKLAIKTLERRLAFIILSYWIYHSVSSCIIEEVNINLFS